MGFPTIARRAGIGAAALLLVLAASCVPARAQTADPAKVQRTITDDFNHKAVALAPGNVLVVRLNATPGIGYSWKITRNDPKVLAPQGSPTFLPPAKSLPGAGGRQVFTFRVRGTGSSTLELAYARPWEKNVKPANRRIR